jgi:hypothetical protein
LSKMRPIREVPRRRGWYGFAGVCGRVKQMRHGGTKARRQEGKKKSIFVFPFVFSCLCAFVPVFMEEQ